MKLYRLTVAALAATTLSACVNLAPEHARPQAATAPEFDSEYRPDGTVVASQLSYSQWFADPRLQGLIGSALANNRDLLAATARIEQARAQFRIQDSQRLPAVGADGSVVVTRQPVTSVDASGNQVPTSVTSDRYQVGVGVSAFELDFWGRITNLSESARAQYLASVAAQRAFYLSLIASTASTYFEILETEQQIRLAEATAQSRREGLRIARLRLDAGVTSALPFRQAETLLTQAEQQLSAEKLALAQLNNQLIVLVGGRVPNDLPIGLGLADQLDQRRLDAGLPSDLLLNRPDIIATEEQLRAARANIGAARAAFFPSVSLTANAGSLSPDLAGLFDAGSGSWLFQPSISLPIFNAGKLRASLDYAELQKDIQVASYEKAIQTAFQEVADGLAARATYQQQLDAQRALVKTNEEYYRLAERRYRTGVDSYLTLLDAQRQLFSVRQQLIGDRLAQLTSEVELYKALGGGWSEPSQLASAPAQD